MWSGRVTAWQRDPRRYVRALTADIRKTYPQLGKVAVDYAWSGTLGQSDPPHAADRRAGPWRLAGERFRRPWLNTTAMAGNLIARAIVDGDQTWRRFTPFELVWAGGVLGRGDHANELLGEPFARCAGGAAGARRRFGLPCAAGIDRSPKKRPPNSVRQSLSDAGGARRGRRQNPTYRRPTMRPSPCRKCRSAQRRCQAAGRAAARDRCRQKTPPA